MMLTLLASLALSAQQPEVPHVCESVGGIAFSVMKARQANVPMSEVRKAVIDGLRANDVPQWVFDLVGEALIDAYSRPSYYTPEAKAEEVMRFRNDWELRCFQQHP